MNASYENGLPKEGAEAGNEGRYYAVEGQLPDNQADESWIRDRQGTTEPVNERKTAYAGQDGGHGIYRTRWLAWGLLGAGWAGSVAAVLLRGGAVEWFMAAVLSMIVIVSCAAPMLAAVGLTAVRELSHETTREGGTIAVRLTLRRSLLIPFVWIALSDETVNQSSPARQGLSLQYVFMPIFRKEMTVQYAFYQLQRGLHPFEHVSVTVGDWLGLTAIRKQLSCKAEFVVLPGLPQADQIKPEQLGGSAPHAVRSRAIGEARDPRGEAGREEIEAAVRAAGWGPELRPYREGDSLRHLDWRSAAKGRGLQTKWHALAQPVRTYIAVDTLASAYDQDNRLFDACIGWAAMALAQAASLGHGVTLLLGQEQAALESTEAESASRLPGMLHAMALLRPEGRGSLSGSLSKSSGAFSRGSTILVFTADWRGGRSWGELAGYAAEQGCRLELFIVTRSSMPTFAMREQQKWLESGGVKLTWLHVPASMDALPYAEEGGDFHELA
ncbi:DUF58 domain-containing protein [Paenibacillus paridis]|uniref:DUF58 domain-containing protein n=1 Tax=Paenibacillus paridis TaxID=2583376 RepID=UPI0013919E53|nr:DUF58 domain-containing protein [Paenibacillus paridis]